MRAAEGGEEVIQRHLISQVQHRELQPQLHLLGVQHVVVADADIENAVRGDARRIGIVILGSSLGNHQPGSAIGTGA